jgi:hypothetical protein
MLKAERTACSCSSMKYNKPNRICFTFTFDSVVLDNWIIFNLFPKCIMTKHKSGKIDSVSKFQLDIDYFKK